MFELLVGAWGIAMAIIFSAIVIVIVIMIAAVLIANLIDLFL